MIGEAVVGMFSMLALLALLGWTTLFDEFRSDFTELLNGLVVLTTERS